VWLRRLLRDKETRPTTAQALCCFALLLVLRWFSDSLGREAPLLVRSLVVTAAFVAAPPIFMAVLLTTRPRQVLAAWWPAWPYLAAALLLVPAVVWGVALMEQFPRLLQLLRERQLFIEQAFASGEQATVSWSVFVLVLAFLLAAGKEIAFRGFIFAGLLKRMRPWSAILVSSFLFAAYHMNVFLVPPLFVLGIALGVLALRSGSLLPGIILHGSCKVVLMVGSVGVGTSSGGEQAVTWLCTAAAVALLWWQNRRSGSGLVAALLAVPHPVTPPAPDPEQPRTPAASGAGRLHS